MPVGTKFIFVMEVFKSHWGRFSSNNMPVCWWK